MVKKIQYTTFSVLIGAERKIKLLQSNTVLANAQILSIRTRRFSATAKSLQGKTIANDANFDAAFVTFKKGTETVVEQLPVLHILNASTQHPTEGYPLDFVGLDWNTSELEVAEGVALDTGKVFEFTVGFIPA